MKRVWIVLAVAGVCLGEPGCGGPRQRPPGALAVTPEAVVLIQDNEARCATLAKTGVERLRLAEAEQQRAREAALSEERLRLARVLAKTEPPATSDGTAGAAGPPATPPPTPADRFAEFLAGEAAGDLAVIDRSGELAAKLLPQVDGEAPPATAQAVRDLLRAEEEVCRAARGADSSTMLRKGAEAAVRGYQDSAAKLAALVTPSEVDVQFARHKYGALLDQARAAAPSHAPGATGRLARMTAEEYADQRREWAATQELQTRQQAEHESAVHTWRSREADEPRAPLGKVGAAHPPLKAGESRDLMQQRMRGWFAVYNGKAAPVRAALSKTLGLLQKPGADARPACRELLSTATTFLTDPAALDAPDDAAGQALKKAYGELQELGRACSAGLPTESTFRLANFERQIENAATTLKPYGVRP
jgi:hypothetical protein